MIPIWNGDHIHLDTIIWQPFFQCISKCPGCYIAQGNLGNIEVGNSLTPAHINKLMFQDKKLSCNRLIYSTDNSDDGGCLKLLYVIKKDLQEFLPEVKLEATFRSSYQFVMFASLYLQVGEELFNDNSKSECLVTGERKLKVSVPQVDKRALHNAIKGFTNISLSDQSIDDARFIPQIYSVCKEEGVSLTLNLLNEGSNPQNYQLHYPGALFDHVDQVYFLLRKDCLQPTGAFVPFGGVNINNAIQMDYSYDYGPGGILRSDLSDLHTERVWPIRATRINVLGSAEPIEYNSYSREFHEETGFSSNITNKLGSDRFLALYQQLAPGQIREKFVSWHNFKVIVDRCLFCAYRYILNNKACGAGIDLAHIWPSGYVTGCPYDSKGILIRKKYEDPAAHIFEQLQMISIDNDHSIYHCGVVEQLKKFQTSSPKEFNELMTVFDQSLLNQFTKKEEPVLEIPDDEWRR